MRAPMEGETPMARYAGSGAARRVSWRQALVMGALPVALLLAACGDDNDADTSDAANGASTSVMATVTTGMGAMDGSPTAGMDAAATPTMDHAMATPTTASGMGGDASPTAGEMAAVTTETGAAALRATLTNLLQEHVYLAGAATGAAIDGRTAEFDAAAATLDANSIALSEAIGSVYGDEAGTAFLDLWRAHIGLFVDYTTAVAAGDQAAADEAAAALDAYRTTFGEFLEAANPNLPAEAVAAELQPHVATLTAAIDVQAAGDPAASDLLREAASHMPMTAQVLAGGIVAQFPDRFDGAVDTPAADLRAGLNALLQEHTYLAGFATGAALAGRTAEFEATAATLDANSIALADAIGAAYGAEAGEAFLPLWRAHIGFFVDYTTATAAGDAAGQQAAVDDLTGYVGSFATFLHEANGLPEDTLATLLEEHVLGLEAVVDAQAAGDPAAAYAALHEAAMHMQMLADPLAEATVQANPEAFRE